MKSLPKAVLFDWDGTLVDTYSFLEEAHNHTLNSLNLPRMEKGIFRTYFGQPREWVHEQLYGLKAEESKPVFRGYVQENRKRIQPMPGAREFIEFLALRPEIPMGVVSNKTRELVVMEIQNLGWWDHFSAVVGGGEAAHDKPHPAPLELALSRMNLKPAPNIWYVGDTHFDLECAQNAGCRPVIVLEVGPEQFLEKACENTVFFKNFHELPRFFESRQ